MSREFSTDWLMRHQARTKHVARGHIDSTLPVQGVADEIAGLHLPIIQECKRRAWRYVHSIHYKRPTIGEGTCDFIIYADSGRVLNIECKKKDGKLSMEQCIFITWLKKLGHEVHVITSMEEFFAIADKKAPCGKLTV
jgi:hypothetical protein